MVHSFEYTERAKSLTLKFMQDGKRRSIIIAENTNAYIHFQITMVDVNPTSDKDWMEVVQRMRKRGYAFKANPNNVSIFRPVIIGDKKTAESNQRTFAGSVQ